MSPDPAFGRIFGIGAEAFAKKRESVAKLFGGHAVVVVSVLGNGTLVGVAGFWPRSSPGCPTLQ
jgi:hypothetical protein